MFRKKEMLTPREKIKNRDIWYIFSCECASLGYVKNSNRRYVCAAHGGVVYKRQIKCCGCQNKIEFRPRGSIPIFCDDCKKLHPRIRWKPQERRGHIPIDTVIRLVIEALVARGCTKGEARAHIRAIQRYHAVV